MKKFTLLLIAALFAVVAKAQTLVTVPDGVQTKEYTIMASGYNEDGYISMKQTAMVAINGNDVYLQGLAYFFPDAYVKGTLNADNQVVIPSGQFVGSDSHGAEYLCGLAVSGDDLVYYKNIVFDYDTKTGVLSLVYGTYYGETDDASATNVWSYFFDATYTPGAFVIPDLVEVPADLETESYQFWGLDTYLEKEVAHNVQVGFYGDDKVYIKGLSGYLPDAWVVGTLSGNTLTIPETYIGVYTDMFGDMYLYFSGATFTYDKDEKEFFSEKGFTSYENPDDAYKMDEYANVYIMKAPDEAGTPANPSITDFEGVGADYPNVVLSIPVVDVNGNPLATENLYYQLYIEKNGTQSPLTLAASLYRYLDEDMTLIPYEYDDDWDIYRGGTTVYLNQGEDEIATWTKIGVKSIYKGGGETHESDIVWMATTGIRTLVNDQWSMVNAPIYNLAGQRLNAPKKGINIINGRKVVIK
ncbi:MAG: hypothetical protein IJJ68_01495 [Prevotella sp.]|nr:hypothetical protein [Prevotella sp.]